MKSFMWIFAFVGLSSLSVKADDIRVCYKGSSEYSDIRVQALYEEGSIGGPRELYLAHVTRATEQLKEMILAPSNISLPEENKNFSHNTSRIQEKNTALVPLDEQTKSMLPKENSYVAIWSRREYKGSRRRLTENYILYAGEKIRIFNVPCE